MGSDLLPPRVRRLVGNDVVDTGHPRCRGKHGDARFLRRVFDRAESAAIAADPCPSRALWLRWAAKEAAYKVVSKAVPAPPPFTHAEFIVEATAQETGTVSFGGESVPFRRVGQHGDPPELLHVLALDPALSWPAADAGLLAWDWAETGSTPPDGRFTARERAAIHSPASALVRLAARAHLARLLNVDEGRLEIVCAPGAPGRAPPLALLDGQAAPADVSLSHHGRWVAWSILLS